jgi:hypothetical protein
MLYISFLADTTPGTLDKEKSCFCLAFLALASSEKLDSWPCLCLGHFLIDDVFPVDQLLQIQQNCVFKVMDKIRELTAPELDLILGQVPSMYKPSILRPWFATHFFKQDTYPYTPFHVHEGYLSHVSLAIQAASFWPQATIP